MPQFRFDRKKFESLRVGTLNYRSTGSCLGAMGSKLCLFSTTLMDSSLIVLQTKLGTVHAGYHYLFCFIL